MCDNYSRADKEHKLIVDIDLDYDNYSEYERCCNDFGNLNYGVEYDIFLSTILKIKLDKIVIEGMFKKYDCYDYIMVYVYIYYIYI